MDNKEVHKEFEAQIVSIAIRKKVSHLNALAFARLSFSLAGK